MAGRSFGNKRVSFSSSPRSTWSLSDKTNEISISNSNFTATSTSPALSSGVRNTIGHNSGTWHFEVAWGGIFLDPGYPCIGIANKSQSLNNNDIGLTQNCIEYQLNGKVYYNNSIIGTGDSFTSVDAIAIEVDLNNSNFYVQKVAGTGRKGPFSFSGMSFPAYIIFAAKTNGPVCTLNSGQAPFAITPTSGYSAWG